MRWLAVILLLALSMTGLKSADAHALDPGYLSLENLSGDTWRVFWRKPDVGGGPMAIDATLPDTCTPATGSAPHFDGVAWVSEWVTTCPSGLAGTRITINGLDAMRTDVLIRVQEGDTATLTARATPGQPFVDIPVDLSSAQVFRSYLALGFEHILDGLDHLLFVFALLVLIQSPGRLIGAITAFTVAHSITLAAASLGVLTIPGPPVEAVIALSIVLIAVEILRQHKSGEQLTVRHPWVVAFLFGLLHGVGFAGALSDIGLPQGDIPMALLAFNVGVEAGQLTFVAVILALFLIVQKIWPHLARLLHEPGAPGTIVFGYAIGFISVYWVAERVAGF